MLSSSFSRFIHVTSRYMERDCDEDLLCSERKSSSRKRCKPMDLTKHVAKCDPDKVKEEMSKTKIKVVYQRPTKMKLQSLKNTYPVVSTRRMGAGAARQWILTKLVMKIFNVGPSHIKVAKIYAPSAATWLGAVSVSTVYFWLYLIEHGLPQT